MARNHKIGITLIAIGVCFPLALLLFVSGYKESAGFIVNLLSLKIMVGISEKLKIGIPYRFFLAFGVLLVFFGIRCCFDKVIKNIPPENNDKD
ncbi:MAG: hypothetical protein NT178_01305 [Proteobacteria bacterium]|nr:hypothetical protein [Pseudomonadota bacterium]